MTTTPNKANKFGPFNPSLEGLQTWLLGRPGQAAESLAGGRPADDLDQELAISTDKADYAPGSTATFTATGVTVGGTVRFSLMDDPRDPGDDGDVDNYGFFDVVDGGKGDLDGIANGVVVTEWLVPATDDGKVSDTADALNATVLLKVTDLSTQAVATTTFTDGITVVSSVVTDTDETVLLQGATANTATDPGATAEISTDTPNTALTDAPATTALGAFYTTITASTSAFSRQFDDDTQVALSGYSSTNPSGSSVISITGESLTTLKFSYSTNVASATAPQADFIAYTGSNYGSGQDSGLVATNGGVIRLFQGGNAQTLLGFDAAGQLAIALYLDITKDTNGIVTGAKVWSVKYEAIQHGTTAQDELDTISNLFISAGGGITFNTDTLASGQNAWNAMESNDKQYQVIMMSDEAWSRRNNSGRNAQQWINSSKGGGPTTIGVGDQMLDGAVAGANNLGVPDSNGDATSFTFCKNSSAALIGNSIDRTNFTTIAEYTLFDVRSATWSISQQQGSGQPSIATIQAFKTASGQTGNVFAQDVDRTALPNDDLPINITSIRVVGIDGTNKTFTTSGTQGRITVTFTDGVARVQGLTAKDQISYSTGDLSHNRVTITNSGVDGTNKDFDIGSLAIDDTISTALAITVRYQDDAPTVAALASTYTPVGTTTALTLNNEVVQLDDDNLPSGNPDGTGDDREANATGVFQYSDGADGTAGVIWTTGSTALSGFTFVVSPDGTKLTISQNGTVVVEALIELPTTLGGNYEYNVTQKAAIQHPDGNNENNVDFLLTYKVTDGDTDFATGQLVINVDDDTPTATGTAVTGTVDEDGLTAGIAGGTDDAPGQDTLASGSVAGIFQSGADVALTWSLNDATAGLPALSSAGVGLLYSIVGDTLTAKAGVAGPSVFTFQLTSAGAYTFTLLKALDHAAGANENDITINFGAFLKATDKDGDSVVAAAEKLVITVDDDTPTATGTAVTGTVDEDGLTAGIAGGTDDAPGQDTLASGSVAGIFQSGADVDLTWSLNDATAGLPALSSAGVGLLYSIVGDTLTAKAGVAGPSVFTFQLTSAGAYTFTLLKALDHAAGANENDITINFGAFLKATDKDGDSVVAAAEKLVITVDDDTPTATGTAVTGTVDEDGLTAGIAGGTDDAPGQDTLASGSVAGIFQSGADVDLTWSLNDATAGLPALSSAGVGLLYSIVGDTLTAKAGVAGPSVFTFQLTSAGAYTFTLLKALDHAAGANENDITINFGAFLKATDKDGDSVVAAAEKLVITVDDDTPTATGTAVTGTVDEDGLTAGIAGGTDDAPGQDTLASGSVAGIFQSGADVDLTWSLNDATAGLPALSSAGVGLLYSIVGDTLTAKAGVAGPSVFTFQLTSAGAYTFTLLKALDHAAGANENDITINFGAFLKATDKDGDSVVAAAEKLVITVDDDTPTATGTAVTGTVDEDGLTAGIAGGTDDAPGQDTLASGSVAGIFQSGADVDLTWSLNDATAGLPALSSAGVGLLYSIVGDTLTAKAGVAGPSVFTFQLTSAGAYTFTLLKALDHAAGANENDITINFGAFLKATDKDGDSVVAAAEKLVITVDDDTPTATGTAVTGTVDEDGLTAGIAGGTDDAPGQDTLASGSVAGIFQSGADVDLTWSLNDATAGLPALSSAGVGLLYSIVGDTLTAKAGVAGPSVFTFQLTSAGAYTFTLLKALDHAAGANENDITINFGAFLKATDKDGDSVVAAAEKLVITVDDDTPTATGTAVTGTVDEDGLTAGIAGGTDDAPGQDTLASGSVAGIFQSGADVDLTWSLNDATAGLPALSSAGVGLLYSIVGDTLTAKAGVAGPSVFTFQLTSAGAYTFTLLKALDHAAGANENDITINFGAFLKATDKDGDSVVAAAEKLVITVDDDTPTATGTAVTGTVDEDGLTAGIAGGTDDAPGQDTLASGSVAGIFQSGADVDLTWSLNDATAGLPALSSAGVGLLYSIVGDTLTAKAGVAGPSVFTFQLTSAGAYTFTLLKALDHAAGANENDITINFGAFLKATDKDGDSVVAAAEKLVITVDDDTPTATGTAVTGTVDEDGLTAGIAGGTDDAPGQDTLASGSVAGIFQSGADVDLTWSLNDATAGLPALSSAGVGLLYSIVGDTLTAKAGVAGPSVFTFQLTSAGAYTFTLLKALDHAAGANENDITINFGAFLKATDKDGDSVVAAAEKLVITVDDDTPTATGTAVTGTVDEDGLTAGIAGGTDDAPGQDTLASGSVAGIFQSGADVDLTWSLNDATAGLPALSSAGVGLLYSIVGDTLTAKAGVAGPSVFTFQLTSAGAYTFTLLKALDHAAGANENDITINFGAFLKATDKDGDSVVAAAEKLVITVDDDTPTATGTAVTGTVDEDGLTAGIAGGTDDAPGQDTLASGSVAGIFQSGADVDLTWSLNDATAGLPALSSAGVGLLYSIVGDTLTAKAGVAGPSVFTFQLTSAGAYTFTLLKALDHAAGANENDITINFGAFLKATDKDGDSVVAAAEKLVITVDDDTPTATGTAVTGTVDEDGLTAGIAGGTDDAPGQDTLASGSVAGIFQSGADVDLTWSLNDATAGLPALSSAGVGLLYSIVGDTLTAKAGVAGPSVFTFQLTSAGAYTFTLLKALDHAAGANENDITINFGAFLKATDKDGDSVVAAAEKLVITVDDDTPTATGTAVTGTVDEDGLTAGIAGGTDDAPGQDTLASGSVAGIFQSGADVDLTWSLNDATAGLPALSSAGVGLLYSIVGDTLTAKAGVAGPSVFTFQLTSAGAYTFTLLKALDHAAGANENDITINFGAFLKATDKDGDSVVAAAEKLVITVDDDTPTATGTAVTGTVDEDGSNLAGFATNGLVGSNSGGTGDVNAELIATGSITTLFNIGADQSGSYGFSLTTTATSDQIAALLSATGQDGGNSAALKSGTTALTYAITADANEVKLTAFKGSTTSEVFTLTLIKATGAYTFTLKDRLDHAAPATSGSFENNIIVNFGALIQAKDFDQDSSTAAAGSFQILINDDSPVITTAVTPTNLTKSSDGTTLTGSGSYSFSTGSDTPVSYTTYTDFVGMALAGTVGTSSISSATITKTTESSSTAIFSFSFSYDADPGTNISPKSATGTLTFDKTAGTYSIQMTPLAGFSILNTAGTGAAFTGYRLESATTTNSQPPVVVAKLADQFFVQFNSYKTGGNAGPLYAGAVGSTGWVAGETIGGPASWVSASGTAVGVAGDTMDDKEVLDFDLFKDNPLGFTGAASTAKADGLYLKFDGIGATEDFIVLLKLDNGSTFALYVANGDIIKGSPSVKAGPGIYSGVALDNNDGLVVIEQNDYAFGTNAGARITGVQIITDELYLTGTAKNLNGDIGTTGGSGLESATSFSSDINSLPMKISDIGFVNITNGTLPANLNFTWGLSDSDTDVVQPQSLTVNIAANLLTLNGEATTGGAMLTQAELDGITESALSFWGSQGVDASALEQLRDVDILIGQLDGKTLAYASDDLIVIDDDAAGHGWSESLSQVSTSEVDLLSAVIHEYGHILGYEHDLLGDSLAVGERILPQIYGTPQPLI